MLWHDNISLLKMILDVEVVHVQRFLPCRIVDAKFWFSGKSLLVRRYIYQIRLPRCQPFDWYYDQKEEDRQYRKAFGSTCLCNIMLAYNA